MALSLGNINFGIGIDTGPLDAAAARVRAFGKVVEDATNRTAKGAAAVAAGLRAQERAMTSALQRAAALQQQMQKARAPAAMYGRLTADLDKYVAMLGKGKVSALEFQRANIFLASSLNRSRRELRAYQNDLSNDKGVSIWTKAMNAASAAAVLITGPLGGLAARITVLNSAFTRGSVSLVAIVAGLGAMGFALYKISGSVTKTTLELDKLRNRLMLTTGSAREASESFQHLVELSLRTGADLGTIAGQYTRMSQAVKGTSLEGQKFVDIFDKITLATSAFQLTADETAGVLKAFEQIISKGTVQAEELRGQLGDRLVGAFNVAARAMGVTTEELNKMIKAGEVASETFVPKFVDAFLRSLGLEGTERIETIRAAMGRLSTSWTLFNDKISQSLGIADAMMGSIDALASSIVFLTEHFDTIAASAAGVVGALALIAAPTLLRGFGILLTTIRGLAAATLAWNAALLANPVVGLTQAALRLTAALVGAAAGYLYVKAKIDTNTEATQKLTDEINDYIKKVSISEENKTHETQNYLDKVNAQLEATKLLGTEEERRIRLLERLKELSFIDNVKSLVGIDPGLDEQAANDVDARNRIALTQQQWMLEGTLYQQRQRLLKQADQARAKRMKALNEIDQEKERMKALADAYREGEGSAKALEDAYKRFDAIKEYMDKLDEAKIDQHFWNGLIKEFAQTLKDLDAAKSAQQLRDFNQELSDTRRKIEAIQEGPAQASMLDTLLGNEEVGRKWTQTFIGMGLEADEAAAKAQLLVDALNELASTTKTIELQKTFEQINYELGVMNAEIRAISEGPAALAQFERQSQVADVVRNMTKSLKDQGVEINKAREIAEGYGATLNQLLASRAIYDHMSQLRDMRDSIEVFRDGAKLAQEYNLSFDDAGDVARFAQTLRQAGLAQNEVNAAVAEFIRLRKLQNQVAAEFEGMKMAAEGIEKAWSDAFDSIGDAIVDAFAEGKNFMESMANIAKSLGKELIKLFLQLAIINPLKNQLLNPATPYPTVSPQGGFLGGLFGGGGSSALAPGSTPANPAYVIPVGDGFGGLLGGLGGLGGSAKGGAGGGATLGSVLGIPSIGAGGSATGSASTATTISGAVSAGVSKALSTAPNVTQIADSTQFLSGFLSSGKAIAHVEGLSKELKAGLSAMLRDAPEGIGILSGFRSVEHQQRLWDDALSKYGSAAAARKWVAPPGSSMHNFGNAADLTFANDAARDWAHKNASKYGLKFPMKHEPWHIEPLSTRGGPQNFNYGALSGDGQGMSGLTESAQAASDSVKKMSEATNAATTATQAQQAASQAAATSDQQKALSGQQAAVADQQKATSATTSSLADQQQAISSTTAATSEQTLGASATTAATQINTLGASAATASASMGGGGGILGGLIGVAGGLFNYRKGGAWNKGVRYAAKGMMLSRPTMFGTSSGPVIGGEAGTEAILPLKRDSKGNLGVAADSEGGKPTTLIQNIYATDMRSVQKSRFQIASMGFGAVARSSKFSGMRTA